MPKYNEFEGRQAKARAGDIMGIRFYCPQGHKLNVKEFQAGRRGICPFCGEKILIPTESSRPSSKAERQARRAGVEVAAVTLASHAAAPPTGPAVTVGEFPEAAPREESPAAAPANLDANNAPPAVQSYSTPAPALNAGAANLAPDPLADAAEVVWYVRPPTGGQFGPATPEIIRGWLAEGRISTDTLVWREGWRDWLEAGGVFPQLNLPFTNPLAALNIPAPVSSIPQRPATPSLATARPAPNNLIWLITALGIFTLLVIAVAIWFWVK
jgi:hypothetical protein